MSVAVTTCASFSVIIITLIIAGITMVMVVTDSLAMLVIARGILAVFFLRHLQGASNRSVPAEEEEEEEEKGGRVKGSALALLAQLQLSHVAAHRPHHLFEVR